MNRKLLIALRFMVLLVFLDRAFAREGIESLPIESHAPSYRVPHY